MFNNEPEELSKGGVEDLDYVIDLDAFNKTIEGTYSETPQPGSHSDDDTVYNPLDPKS